jgi:pimeloyl-ACP methyl ester carboxylesterase
VTLLHGVGLNADAWGAQINTLSQDYEVTAFDMAGHGDSAGLKMAVPTLSDYVDAVRVNLTAPTVVVGHSMGAMIALQLAQDPAVIGVVALNAIYQRTPMASAAVRARATQLRDEPSIDPEPTLMRWFDDLTSPEAMACESWLRIVPMDGYRAAYSVFANENGPTASELQSLNKPALFITGEREPNSTPEMSIQMAECCPMGQAHILNDAAHMMPMTHAGEVNAQLRTFISQCHQGEV